MIFPLHSALGPLGRKYGGGLWSGWAGIQHYWHVDETSGTRYDAVGTAHLTDNNTVGYTTGIHNNAASFAAISNEYLSCADAADLEPGSAATWSFWVYRDNLDQNNVFISKWDYNSDGGYGWQSGESGAGISGADLSLYIATSKTDDGTGCRMDFLDANQSATIWYHIVIVFDGSQTGNANRLKVYQNNSQLTLTVGSGAVPASILDSGASMHIGLFNGLARYLDADMDEVGFWNRALTATEVGALYNAGSGRFYPN